MSMTHLSHYHYHLPDELIAQVPLANRSDSRLLVLNKQTLKHRHVNDLPSMLQSGDRLIFNNTKVIPARLQGQKLSGGKLEFMLERVTDKGTVLAKIRCSKSPKPGSAIVLKGLANAQVSIQVKVIARHDDLFELGDEGNEAADNACSLVDFIALYGDIPLPPYIRRKPEQSDSERYQTVYAQEPGAVAAPTAGLHFDEALLQQLSDQGVDQSFITLHVGAGTFQPVRASKIEEHIMHAERAEVTRQVVDDIKATKARGGRVIAVGTTCVRSLEAAAAKTGQLEAFNGETRLFITPGFQFNAIDAMITNFHLPESTLLMLVSAFAGHENTLAAYKEAVDKEYRFFSYGDAMLVLPDDRTESGHKEFPNKQEPMA